MVSPGDVVLAISNSGESHEILALVPVIKRLKITLICLSSRPESAMAKAADLHLTVRVPQEACPLGLAPTSSTTATLVMGDALAVALLEARGFTANDFALSHPGGHWAGNSYCMSAMSCMPVRKCPASPAMPHYVTPCWRLPARKWV